jgi:YVTN family beta-propeller protein
MRKRGGLIIGAMLCYLLMSLLFVVVRNASTVAQEARGSVYNRPTYSSPIALSANNAFVWSVNPDDNTVTVIRTDTNAVVRTIRVGDEPQSIALDPGNRYAYIANAAGNNVTVIRITNANPNNFAAVVDTRTGPNGSLITGAEPFNIVISPDGKRVFVANSSQDTITVIDATTRQIIGDVNLRNSLCNANDPNRHFQPRGLAVTQDNKRLYVTRFLSFTKRGGVQGDDNGREGVVCRLDINTNSINITDYVPRARIKLAAQAVNEFDTNGDGTPDPAAAFPNQLQSIVIRDGHAYLPNIAASPSRPLRFSADTQAFVNRIDGISGRESDAGALNLHLGAREPEPGKKKLFFANLWAIAFTTRSGAGTAYAVSAGSDLLVKLNVAANGTLSFTTDENTTRYIDLNDPNNPATSGANAGKNPLGIAINNASKTAYVMNYVSRNVSVVDLTTDSVVKVIQTSNLPSPGSAEEVIEVGAEMFFSSRGNFVGPAAVSTQERLSSEGWQSCASCHFAGLTDGVIWQFNTGPRKSVPLNSTFDPNNPNDQRVLNYSAIFDEVQDFEGNIRNVSGPGGLNLQGKPPQACSEPVPPNALSPSNFDPNHGLLFGDNGNINQAPCEINAFRTKANANRQQHKVQLPGSNVRVNALDALNEWVRFAVRTPNGPLTTSELAAGRNTSRVGVNPADVRAGRKLFLAANCQACHSGGKWTISTKDFTSPPAAEEIATETDPNGAALPPNPNGAQYLFRFLRNINSFNLNVPGSGNAIRQQPQIGAVEKDTNNNDALGFDHNGDGKGTGFNVPSLLGIHATPPYYHNGACETLDCVLADVNHRRAGLSAGQRDPLRAATARGQLKTFLESIDKDTRPIR